MLLGSHDPPLASRARPGLLSAGLLSLALAALACGPACDGATAPTAQRARAAYEADRALVDATLRRITDAVREARLLERVEAATDRTLELRMARSRRTARFREVVLPEIIRDTERCLGAELRVEDPLAGSVEGDGVDLLLARAGDAPPRARPGAVRAAAEGGLAAQDRRLGYGLYELEHAGAQEAVSGYEVTWLDASGDRPLRVTLFFAAR